MSEFTSDIVIGLEVHIQLKTKTKLFCPCATGGNDAPNSRTCPVCLGFPGSKPTLNAAALDYAMKLALALEAGIARKTVFSRKTYFYPDLAKNYQITQYEAPLATGGRILLDSGKEVRIKRLHVEEDPAALQHFPQGCYVDYNRSGIPLVELVTEPDMTSPAEAREFMKKLLSVLRYLDIFDQDTCVVKADVNVSVKRTGYTRVEVKNITGFKEIERAIEYEAARQQSEEAVQETRGWDADHGVTTPLRKKETEEDYGYISDPDFPPYTIDEEWIARVQKTIPELAHERHKRFVKQYGVDSTDAHIIAQDKALAEMFERFAETLNPSLVAKWLRRELLRVLNLSGKGIESISEAHLFELLEIVQQRRITDRTGQRLIERLAENDFSPAEAVKAEGLEAVSDDSSLRQHCKDAIDANPKAVEDYRKGEAKALNFLIGQVMRKTKGQATPAVLTELMKEILG